MNRPRSPLQTSERLEIINGAIRGLAGPNHRTAIIIPCTVIRAGDLADKLLDRQTNPHWHGERTKMVYQFPGNAKPWAEYAKIRQESLRADGDGREATEFYRAAPRRNGRRRGGGLAAAVRSPTRSAPSSTR